MSDLVTAVAHAIDDKRLTLTRAYAGNDPEIREIARVAIDTVVDTLIGEAKALKPELDFTVLDGTNWDVQAWLESKKGL